MLPKVTDKFNSVTTKVTNRFVRTIIKFIGRNKRALVTRNDKDYKE